MQILLILALLLSTLNADIIVGIYSGVSNNNADVKLDSTDLSKNNSEFNINSSSSITGAKLGVANELFRYYFSYDKSGNDTLELTRALMNFDYIFYSKSRNIHPIIGGAVGYGGSKYLIQNQTVKQTNGLAALRTGLIYTFNNHSLDLIYEYTHAVNTGHTSNVTFVSGANFTKYNLDTQHNSSFILGYTFRF